MPAEIIALLDKPWLLAIILAIGAGLGIAVERFAEGQKRAERRAYWAGRNGAKKYTVGKNGPIRRNPDYQPDACELAANQLQTIMRASFTSRALLNRPEAKVFLALDQAVISRNSSWQVMAQVSLGEFLGSADKNAFLAVNSKRVDFALMDPDCRVRHALEYQGNGHHQGASAAARDAVKREALRKAGIGYHEIVAGHTTPAELKRLVEKLVPAE